MKESREWPGKIVSPPKELMKPKSKIIGHCVYFFGSYDYGWVPKTDLKPYKKLESEIKIEDKEFEKAIEEIENYIYISKAKLEELHLREERNRWISGPTQ